MTEDAPFLQLRNAVVRRAGRDILTVDEFDRLVLVKDGAVFADGPKEQLLTSAMMSALFDVPMEIKRTGSYYALVSAY